MFRKLPQWMLDRRKNGKRAKIKASVASKKPSAAKTQLVVLDSSDEQKEEEKTQAIDANSSDKWEEEPKPGKPREISKLQRESKTGKSQEPKPVSKLESFRQEMEAMSDEEPEVIRDDLQEPEVVDGNRKYYGPWLEHLKALQKNKNVERARLMNPDLARHWCKFVMEHWLDNDVKNLLEQYKEEKAKYNEIDEFRFNLVRCKQINSSYFRLSYWQFVVREFLEKGMTLDTPIPDLSEIVIEELNQQMRDYLFQLKNGLRQTALDAGLPPHREKFQQWKAKYPKFTAECQLDDDNMRFLS